MSFSLVTLDVRPTLRSGGEPFPEIMQAVEKLESGQGLRLLTTFKPVPLYSVMQKKGFTHCEKEIEGGDWEILFKPEGATAAQVPAGSVKQGRHDASNWPAPSKTIDNRGLMPPEPMVTTMNVLLEMAPGEVLEGYYDREPQLLYPELEEQGHLASCEKVGVSEYRVRIRRGGAV
ncbi:MAG TPA: DUF2249 domain-containing protein [Burkholderiaceae bacterium]|jgi:TusA-related sulfurtransferase|nr:DUF2249 domain-containing protein [Burkholderiaceae bacterium]